MAIEDVFELGMKIKLNTPIQDYDPECCVVLNLGSGNSPIPYARNLDRPEWFAENGIPLSNNSVSQIHAYHFLDQVENPTAILKECDRVLIPGGHINIVVPYYTSQLRVIGLTSHTGFCERTWGNLFSDKYYNKNFKWSLRVHLNLVIGVEERNLCLLTQLVKV
jgi:SAM-dependent methyltransferase